jgi:D-arabinose 1-dehydrogenase-like Zn-dependent alcohol dehydrogenase
MRAAIFERQGLDYLNIKEGVEQPTITDHDVLIKVKSAGVKAHQLSISMECVMKILGTWKHFLRP